MVDLERKKKRPYFSLCLPVCRTYKAEFCEIWSRGHDPGKNPILMLCFGSKDYYHGLVTNYILKMSGLPALEEVCYDHTMQL